MQSYRFTWVKEVKKSSYMHIKKSRGPVLGPAGPRARAPGRWRISQRALGRLQALWRFQRDLGRLQKVLEQSWVENIDFSLSFQGWKSPGTSFEAIRTPRAREPGRRRVLHKLLSGSRKLCGASSELWEGCRRFWNSSGWKIYFFHWFLKVLGGKPGQAGIDGGSSWDPLNQGF